MSIYNDRHDTPKNDTIVVPVETDNLYTVINEQITNLVDINDSVVFLNEDINNTTLIKLMIKIRAILANRMEGDDSPINLVINSSGGDVYEMLGIIDYLETLDVKVNTICRGRAMSSAAVILACGTGTRMCSRRSAVMFHQASTDLYGKAADVNSYIRNLNFIEDSISELLASKTKKDVKWWKENQISDMYLTPEQLLEYGIIDEII